MLLTATPHHGDEDKFAHFLRLIDPDLAQIVKIMAPDFRQSGVAQGVSELSSLSLHADQTFATFDSRQHELDRADNAEGM